MKIDAQAIAREVRLYGFALSDGPYPSRWLDVWVQPERKPIVSSGDLRVGALSIDVHRIAQVTIRSPRGQILRAWVTEADANRVGRDAEFAGRLASAIALARDGVPMAELATWLRGNSHPSPLLEEP